MKKKWPQPRSENTTKSPSIGQGELKHQPYGSFGAHSVSIAEWLTQFRAGRKRLHKIHARSLSSRRNFTHSDQEGHRTTPLGGSPTTTSLQYGGLPHSFHFHSPSTFINILPSPFSFFSVSSYYR